MCRNRWQAGLWPVGCGSRPSMLWHCDYRYGFCNQTHLASPFSGQETLGSTANDLELCLLIKVKEIKGVGCLKNVAVHGDFTLALVFSKK